MEEKKLTKPFYKYNMEHNLFEDFVDRKKLAKSIQPKSQCFDSVSFVVVLLSALILIWIIGITNGVDLTGLSK